MARAGSITIRAGLGLCLAMAPLGRVDANPAASPCVDPIYRLVLVHVTRRAPEAPPAEGKGAERIRIGHQRPFHGQSHGPLALCSFVHEQHGHFSSSVPVAGALLLPGGRIRLHASVVHGDAIDIDLRPYPRRLTISRHSDGKILEQGYYRVSRKPFEILKTKVG